MKFQEPLVPFRSLKCCRALNVGLGPPEDVPEDHVALQQRSGGVTLTLYAAEGFTWACTYCGFMQRLDDRVAYLPGLSGAHLLVSTVNNTPYVVLGTRGPDDQYKFQEGVELKLLKAISHKLNFTYSLNVDRYAEYGALKNGTWTGLIGDVLYRDSHMALSEISFTHQRTEVISYLYPVLYDVLAYITKAPRVIPFALAIVRPLSETMWACLVLALVGSSAFLYCLRWSPVDRGRSHRPDFWFLLSTLSRQNPWEEEHTSAGYRVFLGPWWLFVLVLTTLYSARLVAIMSVAVYEPWLSDLAHLEEALARRELLLSTHRKTIFIEYIKVATSGVLYQARKNQLEGGKSDTLLVSDRKTGLERTLYKSFVYVDSRMSLVTGMELLSEPETMLLRVVGDHLGVEYCGFVFQKGCPLRRIVSDRSRALFETGHMSHWTDVTLRISLPEHLRPEYLVDCRMDPTKKARETVTLTMRDFVGPIWLLGVGYALGLAVLILELAAVAAKRSWRRGLRRRRWLARRRHSAGQWRRLPGRGGMDPLVTIVADSGQRPRWGCRGQRGDQCVLRPKQALP
ncbi:glutamate receptor ionotropic, kainate glr-3-like [Amblyomma americanum]